MDQFSDRHAVARARLFLDKAKNCQGDHRKDFEAYIEASIVFARAAIHRAQSQFKHHPDWKPWWEALATNPSVEFFRNERNWILKVASPKIGQIVRLGGPPGKVRH